MSGNEKGQVSAVDNTEQNKEEKPKFSKSDFEKWGERAVQGASMAQSSAYVPSLTGMSFGTRYSDERLKVIFGESAPVSCFAKINSYVFKYKPEVQNGLIGRAGVDNDIHFGVMAQELEENPFTRSVVHRDPSTGFKTVDTAELTLANTAVISEIAKELEWLRNRVCGTDQWSNYPRQAKAVYPTNTGNLTDTMNSEEVSKQGLTLPKFPTEIADVYRELKELREFKAKVESLFGGNYGR